MGESTIKILTEDGYKGIKLHQPNPTDKYTKVLIKRYPIRFTLDPVKQHGNVLWTRRHEVRGVAKDQVIALWKGDVPERLQFISVPSPNPIVIYNEPPAFCLKCNRWGHKADRCTSRCRCRFCAGHHESSRCGRRIANGEHIQPRCANFGGEHNAHSNLCRHRHRPFRSLGGQSCSHPSSSPTVERACPASHAPAMEEACEAEGVRAPSPYLANTQNNHTSTDEDHPIQLSQQSTQQLTPSLVPHSAWAKGPPSSGRNGITVLSRVKPLASGPQPRKQHSKDPTSSTEPVEPSLVTVVNTLQTNMAKVMSMMQEQQERHSQLQEQLLHLAQQVTNVLVNQNAERSICNTCNTSADDSVSEDWVEVTNWCSPTENSEVPKQERKDVMGKTIYPKNITVKLINRALDQAPEGVGQTLLAEIVKTREHADNIQKIISQFQDVASSSQSLI